MDDSPTKGKRRLLAADTKGLASQGDRKSELRDTIDVLQKELRAQKEKRDALLANGIGVEKARGLTDAHIERLHRYNDIKDAGQILFGKLADVQGKLVKDMYSAYSVDLDD
ncbi:swi5-like zinc finger protein [Linderina pennispora]|nr:swi5-like zinc finger protein [Linderina pennispora]